MHKILSTNDAVNTCDCCGKTGLKFTFDVELDSGEIAHYGSTCVTKHTGRTVAKAVAEIAKREAEIKARKEAAYKRTPEALAFAIRMAEAHKLGLIGRAFKEHCTAEREAADKVRAEIFNQPE